MKNLFLILTLLIFICPTFENAKEISEDIIVYAKEGDNEVLYVSDWDTGDA